jgi:hypothetical protein
MSLYKIPERPKRSARGVVPPLILLVLGVGGILALYFLSPGFQPVEVMVMLMVTGLAALGYRQRILRGIMTSVILYFATGVAATFYPITAPYVGAPFGGEMTNDILALSFVVLMVSIWVALEAFSRRFFKDTSLPNLRILDNLGGVLIYLAVGALVAALLFNAFGYGQTGWASHNQAKLRPALNQVLYVHYTAQSFWFPNKPPPIYIYDLDLQREP